MSFHRIGIPILDEVEAAFDIARFVIVPVTHNDESNCLKVVVLDMSLFKTENNQIDTASASTRPGNRFATMRLFPSIPSVAHRAETALSSLISSVQQQSKAMRGFLYD